MPPKIDKHRHALKLARKQLAANVDVLEEVAHVVGRRDRRAKLALRALADQQLVILAATAVL